MKGLRKSFRSWRDRHQPNSSDHQPNSSDTTLGTTQALREDRGSPVGRNSPTSILVPSSHDAKTLDQPTEPAVILEDRQVSTNSADARPASSIPSTTTPPILHVVSSPSPAAEGTGPLPSDTEGQRHASMPIIADGTIASGPTPPTDSDISENLRHASLKLLRDCLLGGGLIAFSGLAAASQLFPVPGLQIAVTAASQILTIAQAIPKNRGDCQELLHRTSTLVIAITPFAGRPLPTHETLESVERLAKALTEIANDLRTIKADISFRQIWTAVKSVLTYQAVQDRINECSSKLDWAMRFFQIESLAQADLDRIRNHMELRQDIKEVTTIAGTNLLEQRLRPATARYDAQDAASSCLQGTRTIILHDICEWIFSAAPDPVQIRWLYGLAGTGKSTIAHTISEYCAAAGNLGASFFFSRDQADRTDGRRVFSTVAFQLAYYIPSFQPRLLTAVQTDPEAHKSVDLQTQLKKLIIEPLQEGIDAPCPVVLIFDALDECDDPTHAKNIILLLANAASALPSQLRLRIFVTSRPEVHLHKSFAHSISPVVSNITTLHDIEASIVKADIRLFLRTRLQGAEVIATDDEVERLVEMAQSLFIVASTAVNFIEDSFRRSLKARKAQLRVILSAAECYLHSKLQEGEGLPSSDVAGGSPPYRALDIMYLTILCKALPQEQNTVLEESLRSVLGTIVLVFDTLAPRSLDALLRLEPDTVTEALERLHSVITVPDQEEDSAPLRLIHPSFPNFLTTRSRCTDARFYVDPTSHHTRLAILCLDHMNESLSRDMCKIGLLPTLNADVEDLNERLDRAIPAHLRYACNHWASHLARAGHGAGAENDTRNELALQLARAVDEFVRTKLLCWLEVLSLLGRLDAAVPLLQSAEQVLIETRHATDITLGIVQNAQRFVMRFFEPISMSAATIYSSALPFTPKCKFYENYQHELGTCVAVLRGQELGWDPCLHITQAGSAPLSVVYSPNGDHIASGCWDGVVRVWDAHTGVKVAQLEGCRDEVTSVAYSPSGEDIVSGSDNTTVRVWNFQTGAEVAKLDGHSAGVTSVAYSPKGDYLVSGSRDNTARVWNALSGAEVATLRGHNDWVRSVAYSPNADRIASGSDDTTVRVWNSQTGAEIATLDGHSSTVTSVAYSPSGDRIVSGSIDRTVRVWSAQTGAELITLQGHSAMVTSVVYSPNADHIASGSHDDTVRVWNAQTGAEVATLKGHGGTVTSVAYSPNSERVVSGSHDRTIRVWNAQMDAEMAPLEGHSGTVMSIAYSPNGDRVVSGSHDSTVRIWNAQTGAEVTALHGHSDWVRSTAYSAKGDRIVSGSDDKTIRVWNAQTGVEVATLQGHTDWIRSAAYSPNGDQIASGSDDKTVRVWNAQTGVEVVTLKGHSSTVMSVAFSPNDDHLASADDKTIRVWNTQTGSEMAMLKGYRNWVTPVTYSPGGHYLLSQDEFGKLIWHATTYLTADLPAGTELPHGAQGSMLHWERPWVMYIDLRICFLEVSVKAWASSGYQMTLGTASGQMIMLDFSSIIHHVQRNDLSSQ